MNIEVSDKPAKWLQSNYGKSVCLNCSDTGDQGDTETKLTTQTKKGGEKRASKHIPPQYQALP